MGLANLWCLAFVAGGMLVASAANAEACSCFRTCGSILQAKVLFEATVVAIEPDPASQGDSIVRLADVRAIRGGVTPDRVTTGDEASCGYTFRLGTRYLIDGHEFQPGRFGASLCSSTMPWSDAGGILAFLNAPSPELRPRLWGRVVTPRADQFLPTASPPVGVAGAIVTVSGPVTRSVSTSPNGEYSFPFRDLPDGNYRVTVDVPAARRDIMAPAPQLATLGAPGDCVPGLELDAPSTSRVIGRVTTPSGEPARGVRVELFPLPFDWYAGGIVTAGVTDAEGRYRIESVAPGRYGGGIAVPRPSEEQPFAPARARNDRDGDVIDVAAGTSVELPTLVAVPAPPITVDGRVLTAPDVGVASAFVVIGALDGFPRARTGGVTTDASGRFTLTAHRGVRYRIDVERSARIVATAEFVAGDGPVVVTVPPGH